MGATTISELSSSTSTPSINSNAIKSLAGTLSLEGATSDSETSNELLNSLSTLLHTRHSTRAFLPTPVPPELLHTALSLAQTSPSNSNIQNWHMYLITGPALENLKVKLSSASKTSAPKIPPLPPAYAHLRSDMGRIVYGKGWGIPREDNEARLAAQRRNFTFFDAPVAGIVCMNRELSPADAMSVGTWLQSFLLSLTGMGVASCVEVSVAGYEDVIREELKGKMREGDEILCGVAIGFEDRDLAVNRVRTGRVEWEDCVVEIE